MPLPSLESFCFAAVGDVHGRMHRMVSFLQAWSKRARHELDFVLQVGDFEPHRDEADLATMAAPARHKHLGDFADYHQKRRHFPWPVHFIGGNHEPHGYLDTEPRGFQLAPNCHYLGRSSAVDLNGLSVVGVSGIHDAASFQKPHPPLSLLGSVSNKAFTFFHEEDIERALAFGRADVLVVHDWPSGIIATQDRGAFAQQRRSPDADAVGNEYARLLTEALQPRLVLCGHLHKGYRGVLAHTSGPPSQVCCLASVEQGAEAFAVFQVSSLGIREITHLGTPEPA
ncbi:metallophosphoesterase [Myxococcus stipitatus DSM 14675]|uniref:Metallophosphoesterase n=1 Tax=Myxococcus stipitatus (strain DSM 14675 / JCM 12634 / Mx s8) TaxID=1278073 RepID=L7UCF7_MYXSD|nr:metallophosphoesterase [Myxococcus stipitatus]AGC45282.1 metallophosphoesterase [Myxococcus stipitatus DSM 14675]